MTDYEDQVPRHLITHINDSMESYSRAFKQLASYILSETFAASSMSIEELASASNVSIATVNRFAKECSFAGYPQFKMALRQLYNQVFDPIEKATLACNNPNHEVRTSLNNVIENLQVTDSMLNDHVLDKVVDLILSARNIFVAGMGVSTLHATFLVDAMEPFIDAPIKELGHYGVESAFSSSSKMKQGDVFIAISLPRYSKSIVDLTLLAKERQCTIISLTDKPSSPLVSISDETLFAASKHSILYATNAPMVALIEVLVMAIIKRTSNFAEIIAEQTEAVLPYFYIPSAKN